MRRGVSLAGLRPGVCGFVDAYRWRRMNADGVHLHVLLNGRDLMLEGLLVEAADDDAGYVDVFVLNAEGRRFLDPRTREFARDRMHGHVEFLAVDRCERCAR